MSSLRLPDPWTWLGRKLIQTTRSALGVSTSPGQLLVCQDAPGPHARVPGQPQGSLCTGSFPAHRPIPCHKPGQAGATESSQCRVAPGAWACRGGWEVSRVLGSGWVPSRGHFSASPDPGALGGQWGMTVCPLGTKGPLGPHCPAIYLQGWPRSSDRSTCPCLSGAQGFAQ